MSSIGTTRPLSGRSDSIHTAAASLPSPPLTPTHEHDEQYVARAMTGEGSESQREKRQRWIREAGCHFSLFIAGWGDASSGPLIPYIQAHYHISYTVVSMLFVGQMVGFLIAGCACASLTAKFGLGKVIVAGSILQAIAYALLIPAFPFPVTPVIYAIGGIGLALQDAQANVYVATLPNSEAKLGLLHAAYGLGAAVCPLAATAFASRGILFARFYSISLGIAIFNILILLYAFKFSFRVDNEELVEDVLEAPGLPPAQPAASNENIELAERRGSTADVAIADKIGLVNHAEEGRVEVPHLQTQLRKGKAKEGFRNSLLYRTLATRTTLFASLFVFLYVGAEVSMGGWIVTFVIDNRNGGPDAGYVASGYWFGLMLGRLLLNPLNMWVGEQNVLYVYSTVALALEFSIWFADSLVGNAVVVAIVGVLMGPSYPILISVCTKILPRHLHAPGIAIIAALGQCGSAVFPFITGALAQRFNPVVLQPVMVCLLAGQMAAWAGIPRIARKAE
ncbi:hypothetical protein JCM11641_002648 [Rhodosporidiobolus odoratus]